MTNSIRKMLESKEAKRADAVQVRYESIHIEPGFNLRQSGEELDESIEALTQHIVGGGKYPPLEVRIRDEGGVWVVDGHRRHAAIGCALERGAPLRNPKDQQVWIHVVYFEGNDADRTARIITSAANKPLTQIEVAEGYKRLRGFGWSAADIAAKVSKTAEHVQQLLALGNANSDVRNLVVSGKVSASHAAKVARKHGEKAGSVLHEELQVAQAKGKSRITPATAAPKISDSTRLDYLISTAAIVRQGSKPDCKGNDANGFWLEWPSTGALQPEPHTTGRAAIDAAMQASEPATV